MPFVVRANIRGKRIESDKFKTRTEAQRFASETNKNFKGANARVAKVM